MKLTTRELIICSIFASLTAILAQISIPLPFTTVPLTMQLFAVSLCGFLLGPKMGFVSQLVYVLIGVIGIPVFAQMSGGVGAIVGPTGGFILSFPIVAAIIGYFSKLHKSKYIIFIGMLIGLIVSYIIGTVQFSFIMKVSFMEGLTLCVLPFLAVDLLKLSLATIVGLVVSNKINMVIKVC